MCGEAMLGLELSPQVDHYQGQEEEDQTEGDGRGSTSSELWRGERGSLLDNNVTLGWPRAGLDHPGRPLWLKLVLLPLILLALLAAALTIIVFTVLVITNILSAPASRPGALAVAVLVIVTVIAHISTPVVARVVGIF